MTMTERKVIKAKVGLLELAKQLGSVANSSGSSQPTSGAAWSRAPIFCSSKAR